MPPPPPVRSKPASPAPLSPPSAWPPPPARDEQASLSDALPLPSIQFGDFAPLSAEPPPTARPPVRVAAPSAEPPRPGPGRAPLSAELLTKHAEPPTVANAPQSAEPQSAEPLLAGAAPISAEPPAIEPVAAASNEPLLDPPMNATPPHTDEAPLSAEVPPAPFAPSSAEPAPQPDPVAAAGSERPPPLPEAGPLSSKLPPPLPTSLPPAQFALPPVQFAPPPAELLPPRAQFASAGSETPVVVTSPPPRQAPNAVASAKRAAQRVWSARLALLRRAQRALPQVQALGSRMARRARRALPQTKALGDQVAAWLPRAKALGVRAGRALPRAGRWLPPVKRALPKAARWAERSARSAPKSALLAAPFVVLMLLWLVHGIASRGGHPNGAAASAPLAATLAAARPTSAEPQPFTASISAALVPAPAPAPASADDVELRLALAQGLPAMEVLTAKYTGDPQVLIALASAQAQAQRYDRAVASVDRALAAGPSPAQSGKIMGILWRAAQSSATEESFASLRKLGARGADVEFDLATTPGVREAVRERAKAELSSAMALDASADTRAATALLLAPDCATRKSLLDRAERDGGRRTLAMLERLSSGSACNSSSAGACNACLMGSPALAHAITQLGAGAKP